MGRQDCTNACVKVLLPIYFRTPTLSSEPWERSDHGEEAPIFVTIPVTMPVTSEPLGLSPDAFINGNYAFSDAEIMPPQFCAIMPELCSGVVVMPVICAGSPFVQRCGYAENF